MFLYRHLHHQHRCGDQQHAWDRAQHGVNILNHIVHPATKIACGNAHKKRERQHHQGRHRTYHEAGAYAFKRQIQHVLADLVGAKHVISQRQIHRHSDQHGNQQQRSQHGVQGCVLACLHPCPCSHAAARCGKGHDQQGQQHPAQPASKQTRQATFEHITHMLALWISQMRPAIFQTRIIAQGFAIGRFYTFLGIEINRKRRRIGFFGLLAQIACKRIEHTQHLSRVYNLPIAICWQCGTIVQ